MDNTEMRTSTLTMIFWPCDLEIDTKITQGNQCIKFSNFQEKGSKDIEWTTFLQRPAV